MRAENHNHSLVQISGLEPLTFSFVRKCYIQLCYICATAFIPAKKQKKHIFKKQNTDSNHQFRINCFGCDFLLLFSLNFSADKGILYFYCNYYTLALCAILALRKTLPAEKLLLSLKLAQTTLLHLVCALL